MEYMSTIGLEIHAELKTRTKMFCDSPNDPHAAAPNANVCPVCLGHPGTLPTINKQAVELVIKTGLALGGEVAPVSKFDRKNYFYPDLPKGYQISQYDMPLVRGGMLRGVHIRRIHLEEDTGTLIHDQKGKASLVDFNRSGVPLMELVTEPDLHSGEETMEFAKELQLILRYLGVSDADMEKGQMRIEANVSLSEVGPSTGSGRASPKLGTKVELKNINSFRAVRDAVSYELKRQEEALRRGEKIVQETRGWDEAGRRTVSQRSKEEAHDYRYFPEPDLPPFETSVFDPEMMRKTISELPEAKRARFAKEYGLDGKQAELIISEPAFAEYFEDAASEYKELLPAANDYQVLVGYLTSDLRGLMKDGDFARIRVKPEHLAHLAALASEKKITSRQAKNLLAKMFAGGEDPEAMLREEAGKSVSDEGELKAAVKQVIAENPQAVADYTKGKKESMQFLIGKVMQKTKGRAKPEVLRGILERSV